MLRLDDLVAITLLSLIMGFNLCAAVTVIAMLLGHSYV